MIIAEGALILIRSGLASGMKPNDASSIQGFVPASQGNGHILERLVAEIPETEIVFSIREMLNANYVTKSGMERPDYRAREAGIKLYARKRIQRGRMGTPHGQSSGAQAPQGEVDRGRRAHSRVAGRLSPPARQTTPMQQSTIEPIRGQEVRGSLLAGIGSRWKTRIIRTPQA